MKYLLIILFFNFLFASQGQEALFNQFTTKDGLLSNKVYDIVQDSKGNLWFATSKGIAKLEGFDFIKYAAGNDFVGDELIGLHKGKSGELWAYSSLGNIYTLKGNQFRAIALNNQIDLVWGGKIVNCFTSDPYGNLFLGSVIPGELLEVNRQNKTVTAIPVSRKTGFVVREVADGAFVFGTSSSKGQENMLLFEGKNGVFEVNLGAEAGFSKSRFLKRKNGNYLFAVGSEVIDFNSKAITSRLFVEKSVESILEDSEGKIWIGLRQGGVICFPNSEISSLNRIEYLGKQTVTSIYEDNARNLWFATEENGVYHLALSPQINYSAPELSSSSDSTRTRSVQAVELSATSGQLNLTNQETFDTIAPKVFFSGIEINNRDTTILTKYDLTADQNFLKIGFVGSALGNPGLFQYKYRMLGVDKDWVYSSSNVVQYTMLPPGKYIFEVSAMSKGGKWSLQPANIEFVIHPKFYQTVWFKIGSALFGIAILVLGLFLYVSRIKQKESEKLSLGKKIADLELSALRAQMNPHFIFNTLSSIQHFVATNNTEEALRYLSKFAKLMRVILDNSKRKEIPVKDEVMAISLYLELEKLRFKNKFDFEVLVSDNLDQSYDHIPSMLVQPYIENAILHGIMNKRGKGHIRLEFHRENGHLICLVEDNGIGREAARVINESKPNKHKSQGMLITKDRLDIINKVNESNLSVEITDLNPDEAETGTKVKIYIPLQNTD
ncbi:MAG: histidine kinase [Flavobacteriales bacterium]|nr:histidine kinase [Flavobacteriales bacterium]